jgi:triacylglycerol esterase/lipase EstA (alpha/beta hydrolase family)
VKTRAEKVIVLVHGLGANRLMMWLLAQRLAWRGYRVVNWGYRSITRSVENHGLDLFHRLEELDADKSVKDLYLVTHSMGGIVARTALTNGELKKLKRMVMLCPPNRGSRWATMFGPMLKPVCGTLDQLATRPDSYVNTLPSPDGLEVGIIAAAYDPLVAINSTFLGVERDHLVWPYVTHTGVLFRTGVAEQIAHFLNRGEFLRQDNLAMSA